MATSKTPSVARRWNTRLGLILFLLYLLVYLGFVLVCAFATDQMERVVVAGLNLAIVYGFALIAVAFLMALIYGVMCRSDDEPGDAK